jgi:hypothetical protein
MTTAPKTDLQKDQEIARLQKLYNLALGREKLAARRSLEKGISSPLSPPMYVTPVVDEVESEEKRDNSNVSFLSTIAYSVFGAISSVLFVSVTNSLFSYLSSTVKTGVENNFDWAVPIIRDPDEEPPVDIISPPTIDDKLPVPVISRFPGRIYTKDDFFL